ncbi:DsbA family oxidoreductase [Kitasatospora sp. NPDC094011]|uniref:DsbA family oxidoreductase n=1 Tax=Kitasatospora sp. NPDC094011 TaxID=3364090 RepID=UPI003826F372
MRTITVEAWSDVVCPWCYIGKRRLELALADFEERDAVTVVWRSFELDPRGPRHSELTIPQCMQRDLGLSPQGALEGLAAVTRLAAELGLEYRLEQARPVNTFDVHRILHLAEEQGLGEPARERVLRGYTAEGAYLGDQETLVRLAVEAGLAEDRVRELLAGDAYGEAVRADEQRGRAFGVRGVPSFLVDERFSLSGAQPVSAISEVLAHAVRSTA